MLQSSESQPTHVHRRSPATITMLRADHRRIQHLVAAYDTVQGAHAQQDVAHEILLELAIHAHLEAYVFDDTGEEEPTSQGQRLLTASRREQRAISALLQELRLLASDDPRFPKIFDELLVHVEHHIEAEEAQMFPFLEAGWQVSLAQGRTGSVAAGVSGHHNATLGSQNATRTRLAPQPLEGRTRSTRETAVGPSAAQGLRARLAAVSR